ncbi:Iron-enterobactin transporter periplasmic binding protein [Streptomyces sp. KO7888]|uniref:ABC transporter substrate-binding protein n=1 Tax=Streptomyces sp. KO7888 TaxID=2602737 RepID=UPI0013F67A0A|nr:ABC transporter substrate-binding protein [Streptomyces sp. KO7888]NHI09481.1 Iron-enterobactin transporter periplasmic binding protein [Streptomyces sp. KO7888]
MLAPARLLAVALVATLALTGCAASDSSGDGGGGGGGGKASSATTRTVTTDYGKVKVPTEPKRVVVLNHALAGYLYDLDVPVRATIPEDADGKGEFSPYWAKEAKEDGTTFLPWSVDGFDLEAILALEPDLIVGGGIGFPLFQAEKVYDDLSDIAPTVLVGKELGDWRAQFSFLATDVFDKGDVYDEHVAAYDKRITEVKDAIEPPPGPVSFLAFTGDGTAYGLVENVGLPAEFKKVGIEPAPVFAKGGFKVYGQGGDMFELSTEKAGQTITQPSVFVMGFNADTTDVATLKKNPVFGALPAFKSGHAYDLPYWVLRGDYDESMALLDIIEKEFS